MKTANIIHQHKSLLPKFDPYNALTQVFGLPHDTPQGGRLAGMAFAVKENICSERGSTTCCSRILGATSKKPYASPFDATCVKLLKEAGGSLMAKANMDEFGMGSYTTHTPYGSTLNPHNDERTAGGSSGGSAAALSVEVNNRGLNFTLGTDTGGSVRIPASYCGVFGFKPSYGRISRYGVVPYANSLDTVGILAGKTDGLAVLRKVYDVLDVHDEKDPTSLSARLRSTLSTPSKRDSIRIGVPVEYNIEELSTEVLAVWHTALDRLSTNGCELIPIALPLTKTALAAYYILAPSEVSSNLQKYSGVFYGTRSDVDRPEGRLYASTRNLFGEEVKRRIIMGCLSLSSDRFDNYYLQAQRVRRLIVEEFNSIFRAQHPLLPSLQGQTCVDYIVTPTAPQVAPLLSQVAQMSSAECHASDVFTVPASMAGLPSLSVPAGSDATGLPIGIQIIGQYGDDKGVLELAQQFHI